MMAIPSSRSVVGAQMTDECGGGRVRTSALRRSSVGRNDGNGRYDLRPFPSTAVPRHSLYRRPRRVADGFAAKDDQGWPESGVRASNPPRFGPNGDGTVTVTPAVVPPTLRVADTLAEHPLPLTELQPLGGGDGTGGDAVSLLSSSTAAASGPREIPPPPATNENDDRSSSPPNDVNTSFG